MNIRESLGRGFATAATLTLLCAGAWAVPAKPGIHVYTQPDGSTVEVRIIGDEHFHCYETTDGHLLLSDAAGALRYAVADSDGTVRAGDVRASDPAVRTAGEKAFAEGIDRDAVRSAMARMQSRNIGSARRRAPQRIPGELVTSYPTQGQPKSIVLLVEFQDVKFSTPDVHEAFRKMVSEPGYSENGGTGSALDFFRDNSNGAFQPDFEVFGPVTLPYNEPHYGQSSANAYDVQGWMMAYDGAVAMREAYPDLDFSEYDNDGDGFVDNIFIFYAGYGENEGAPSWTIWPHSAELWSMYNLDLTFDGVKIDKYACSNELKGTSGTLLTGIGTFVHEYSHVLGLMDHYPTLLSNRDVSPGAWDVMDMGSYNNESRTPPAYNSFERYCLGWLNPHRLSGPQNVVLNPILDSNEAVSIQTDKDGEFFLFENRQNSGWDAHLPGHGMLVWHVDYDAELWNANHINNVAAHQNFDLVEADGIYGTATRAGDPFPGTGNVHRFTAESNPPMKTWIGIDPDMPVTDIAEVDGLITFRVKGGGDALEIPVLSEATDVTPVSFTANWQLVPGLSIYEVDVCEGGAETPFMTRTVQNSTSLAVDGLKPSTLYSYKVRSSDGERTSYDSEAMFVTTLPPTLDMIAPETLDATNIKSDGFEARWAPLAEATGYLIDVYTKRVIDPVRETADFTDGIVLPEGWETTATRLGAVSGYFGAARPSLQMMYDNERVVTADYPGGINSFSFWYRANSTDDESSLAIENMVNGVWTPVYEIKPLVKEAGGTVVTLGGEGATALLPDGSRQLRLVFHRVSDGSVYVDDFTLDHDASFEPLYVGGLHAFDCGDVQGHGVTGLQPQTRYYYTVTAYDADGTHSLPSDERGVTTGNVGAISAADTDATAFRMIPGGIEIVASEDAMVMLTDLSGRVCRRGTVKAGVTTAVRADKGVYVLTVGGRRSKVVIR